jgi:hypothetical protein
MSAMSATWKEEAKQLENWSQRVKQHQWQQKEHGYWWGAAYNSAKASDAKRLETLADRVWECHAGDVARETRCTMIVDEYNALWQKYLQRN